MRYSSWDRALHFLIGGGMIFLLLIELWMQRPQPGRTGSVSQTFLFGLHEFVGLSLLVIILVRLFDNLEKTGGWFPWLGSRGRAGLLAELKHAVPGWFSGRLQESDGKDYLARSVHGLGLLLALGFGLTGMALFLTILPDGSITPVGRLALMLHGWLGVPFWLFLIGHVGMAVWHQLLGHRALRSMFSFTDTDRQ